MLVVDDDPAIRRLMSFALTTDGYRVVEAADGRSAIDTIEREDVDVVLLDLMMPVMDGWAVLWTLHDMPGHPPVIVMSGRPEHELGEPPLGATRYLHKPFPPEAALSLVEEALAGPS